MGQSLHPLLSSVVRQMWPVLLGWVDWWEAALPLPKGGDIVPEIPLYILWNRGVESGVSYERCAECVLLLQPAHNTMSH